MFIKNKFDVMHTWPDDMPLPAGARKASKDEIAVWEAADTAGKATIRAAKEASRLAHAQTVVVSAPATEPSAPAPEPPVDAKASAKKESDDK